MRSQRVRLLVLFLVLLLMSYIGFRHQMYGSGPDGSPPVDALCPFGGLEGAYGYLKDGSWITRLAPSSLILLITVVLTSIVFGRVFCGWVCPMGAVTEFTRVIAGKLGIKSREFPEKVDAALRYVKYILLAVILAVTWQYGFLFFRLFDPWMAWMHLTSGEFDEMIAPLLVLGLVIVSGIFIERAWCRYLCPLGACFGITQKMSLTKIHRDQKTCIDCGACDTVCPTRAQPSKSAVLEHGDCIACGKCVEHCIPEKPLAFKINGWTLSPLTLGVLGLGFALAIVGFSISSGYWRTSPRPKAAFTADAVTADSLVHDMGVATGLGGRKFKEIAGIPASFPGDKPLGELGDDMVAQVKERMRVWLEENALPFSPATITGDSLVHDLGVATGLGGKKFKEIAGIPASFPGDKPLRELGDDMIPQIRERVQKWVKDNPPPFTAETITGSMTIHDLGVAAGLDGKKIQEITGIPADFTGDTPLKELGPDMVGQVREKLGQWLKDNPPGKK